MSALRHACILGLLLAPIDTSAQILDVSKITCAEFAKGFLDDALLVSTWLSGYYHAKRNTTIVDITEVKMNAQTLNRFCGQHPALTVMQGIEHLSATAQPPK